MHLSQSDFTNGTVFLDQSNTRYVFNEDITFDPQVDHDPSKFVLGFFAAIAITGSDIELDFNGFTLEQSEKPPKKTKIFCLGGTGKFAV